MLWLEFKDYREMSKKEDTIEEQITNEQETVQVVENQEVEVEVVKEELTAEEIMQAEKDKFLRLFAEFENYKKELLEKE